MDSLLYLVPYGTKFAHDLFVTAGCFSRVGQWPVKPGGTRRQRRALLVGIAANGHDNVCPLQHAIIDHDRLLPGDIDTDLPHDRNCLWVLAVRLDARGLNRYGVATNMPGPALGYL